MPIEAPPDPTVSRTPYGPVSVVAPTPATTDGTAVGYVSVPMAVYLSKTDPTAETDIQTPAGTDIDFVTPNAQTGACEWLGPVGYTGIMWLEDPVSLTRWPVYPSIYDQLAGTNIAWDTLPGRPLVVAAGETEAEARAAIHAKPDSYQPTKGDVGLPAVENLSPSQMPVSTQQAAAIAAARAQVEAVALNRANHNGTQAANTIDWTNAATLLSFRNAVLAVTGGVIEEPPPDEEEPPPPPPVTGVPTQIAAAGSSAEPWTINLTWQPPTDTGGKTVSGYIASRNNPAYSTSTLVASTRSFLFTNFTAGTPYTVGVRTVFSDGTMSPIVNATPVTFTGGTTTPPVGGGTVKIMPTGDSLTAVDSSALGWKGNLYNSLVSAGRTIDYVGPYTSTGPAGLQDPNHYGLSGAQTSTLLGQYLSTTTMAAQVGTHQPHIAIILIGVNDLWSNVAVATALSRYRQVLDGCFAAKSDLKVIACRIPLMGVAAESNRAAYNAGISQIVSDYSAAGRSITLADLSSTLVSSDLQGDGIHWTGTGHSKVAAALLPTVQAVIAGSGGGGTTDPTPDPGGTTGSAPMPYPTHGIGMYHMCWSNSGSPPLATTPSNVNNLRLAFFQGSLAITGPASEGSFANMGARLRELRARGVRIIASVGGGGGAVNLSNRAGCIAGIMNFSNTVCPLDGIDFDLEGPAFGAADAIAIVQDLKRQRGANFAVTMAPNGTVIQQYLTVAVAMKNAGITTDGFGHQFYDAIVSQDTMMGRYNEYIGRGLPASKYELGMMDCCGSFPATHYWDVPTMVSRLNYAKSQQPTLGGAYFWERSRAAANGFNTSVGGIIKTW